MIAILNNGTQIKVEKSFVQQIFKDLVASPLSTRGWHCSLNPGSSKIMGFNLDHVSAFVEEEDIVNPVIK